MIDLYQVKGYFYDAGSNKYKWGNIVMATVLLWFIMLIFTYYTGSVHYTTLRMPITTVMSVFGVNSFMHAKSFQPQKRDTLVSHKQGYPSSNNEHLTSGMVLRKEGNLLNLGLVPKKKANFESLVV